MKTLMITKKTLIEAWRDRQLALIYLSFPAIMIMMYYLAFGQITSMANYLTVLVNNRDQGSLGAELIQALRSAEFDGQPVFTLNEVSDPRAAQITLDEGKAALLITIPEDFSGAVTRSQTTPAVVDVLGDPLTDTYVFARSFLTEFIQGFVDQKTGWKQPLPYSMEFLPNTGKMSDFQISIPGLLIFGVLFGTVTSALMLVRETSSGTLQRIRLSGASGAQVLGGVALANLIMALIQVPLSFAVALAFGFNAPGSLLLAIIITLILSLAATGVGFLAACFSHNEGEATGISTALMVPLVFLSGAVFPMPPAPVFSLFGHTVEIYDIMPSTHAAQAILRVVVYGDGLSSIAYEFTLLVVLSLLIFGIGVWVYQRRVLN